jgi:hypothetical protein
MLVLAEQNFLLFMMAKCGGQLPPLETPVRSIQLSKLQPNYWRPHPKVLGSSLLLHQLKSSASLPYYLAAWRFYTNIIIS